MNSEDHAIVIGIRRYPVFGKTRNDPRNLEGPDRDAEAVYTWLTDPQKGGVPTEQATLIRSQCYPDPFAEPLRANARPQADDIEDEFERLIVISVENHEQGQPRRVGRRLYIYASGHGFANTKDDSALVTANAWRGLVHHVNLRGWANWFADSKLFDEVVLLVDACLVKYASVVMRHGGGAKFEPPTGGGKMYEAFAARHPLQALEIPIPDLNGDVRGVFTYALLKGLEGEAVDYETKQITGQKLKDYLINTMKTYLSPDDLLLPNVATEPYIEVVDNFVLRRFTDLPTIPFALSLPADAVGRTLEILTGNPLTVVEQRHVTSPTETISVHPGIQYFARVSDSAWLQDFVVGGANATG